MLQCDIAVSVCCYVLWSCIGCFFVVLISIVEKVVVYSQPTLENEGGNMFYHLENGIDRKMTRGCGCHVVSCVCLPCTDCVRVFGALMVVDGG